MRIRKPIFILMVGLTALLALFTASVTAQTATPTATAPAGQTAQPTLPSLATIAPTPTQTFPLPITQNFSYIVQPRDTLDGIGALFDVSINCIRETNSLKPTDLLMPEQVLIISIECPAYDGLQRVEFPREDAPGSTPEEGTYVVQRGDTLDTIGQELNISVEALQLANNIENPRALLAGDVLIIPEDAPEYGTVPPLRTLAPEETREAGQGGTGSESDEGTYVVQRGDTLDTIAQELDVSLEAIIQANNITQPRALLPGDVLVIPADAPPYGVVPPLRTLAPAEEEEAGTGGMNRTQPLLDEGQYIVQPGDTLDTIGQELDVSVVALQIANNIESALSLRPGDVLVIPEDAPPYGVFPALDEPEPTGTDEAGTGGTASVEGDSYVIQPGDTLDTIAQSLNVSVIAIRQANDIDSALDLKPGRTIIIPADAPEYGTVPATGESAGGAVAQGEQYVLQPGDTLDQIAESYNIDALCLLERNQIRLEDVYYVKPGQIIGIPLDCPEYTGFYVVPEGVTITPDVPAAPQATPTATTTG